MFTGIVRERAKVASFDRGRLVVESSLDPTVGDSVAVDGVCLTVAERTNGSLAFDVMPETLQRAKPFGTEVNLETALRAGDPLGGNVELVLELEHGLRLRGCELHQIDGFEFAAELVVRAVIGQPARDRGHDSITHAGALRAR